MTPNFETMVGDPILMKVLHIQLIPRLICILPIIVSHKRHQMKRYGRVVDVGVVSRQN